MSGGKFFKELLLSMRRLSIGLTGWVFIAPIALLTPRRKDWVAVIGRHGKFIGNAKYFFIQAQAAFGPEVRLTYLTGTSATSTLLNNAGRHHIGGKWWSRTRLLLRVGTIVVDSTDWPFPFFRFMIVGARKVQLWHGVGYKRIGRDKWNQEIRGKTLGLIPARYASALGNIMQALNGRRITYDLINSTSKFYEKQVFKPAMRSHHWYVAGYPRNAFGTHSVTNDLVYTNVDTGIASAAKAWRAEGRRIVLVAPTFRDSGEAPVPLDALSITKLNAFAEKNGVEFIFKLHVRDRDRLPDKTTHVHSCNPDSDIYPILPSTDALVTDYSSIYMDYLLIDRPIIFFVPDLEQYQNDSREFQFDFAKMTPGPKVASWDSLLNALNGQWMHDDWRKQRARLCRMAFDGLPQETATRKLADFMLQRGWVQVRASSPSAR